MTYDLAAVLADLQRPRPGWTGNFTTSQAPGAMPNGTRVTKTASESGDTHGDGTRGHILGSLFHPERGIAYFVEWDDTPKVSCLVMALKLIRTEGNS